MVLVCGAPTAIEADGDCCWVQGLGGGAGSAANIFHWLLLQRQREYSESCTFSVSELREWKGSSAEGHEGSVCCCQAKVCRIRACPVARLHRTTAGGDPTITPFNSRARNEHENEDSLNEALEQLT